jgi:outer membrane protein
MIVHNCKRVVWVVLSGLLGAAASAESISNPDPLMPVSPRVVEQQMQAALRSGEVALDRRSFVQLVLLRNPDLMLTREQQRIAQQQLRSDRGAYTPEFFAVWSTDGSSVQNPANAPISNTIDRNRRFNLGLRTLLRSGAEITVEYDTRHQFLNVSSGNNPLGVDDVTGRLGFKVRQPLMRGMGAAQFEGRIAQSERQLAISRQEILQQTLSKSFDALSLYWRLYRAEQVWALNQASLTFSRRTFEDMQHLVEAGRLPQTALAEVRSAVLLREAEAFAARQGFDQVESAMKGLLNLSAAEYGQVAFRTTSSPDPVLWQRPEDFDRYLEQVLKTWPNLEIALARLALEEHQLAMVQDELRPRLDWVVGYHRNSRRFDNSYRGALGDVLSSRNNGWHTGLEFSMPLGQDAPARARHEIAQIRLQQSRIQVEAVKVDLANQLWVRLQQVEQAFEELLRYRQNIEVLRELLLIEKTRFDTGASRFSDLIEREDKLNSAIVRAVDAEVRYEMAKAALRLSDGTLLERMGVTVDVDMQ